MKKISRFTLLVLLALSACRMPKDLVYQNVGHFTMNQSAISMDVKLYNPNKYCLKLKKADLDLYINGNHLGKVKTKAVCSVTKLDTFTLPVTLAVDYRNILPNALQLLFNSEVDVKLTGKVKAGRHGLYITVPINYVGKQDIRSSVKF